MVGLGIGALLIPIVAYATQVLNMKMTPQSDQNDQMARQMKMMNNPMMRGRMKF